MAKHIACLAAAFVLAGCAATRFENYPLADNQSNEERRAFDVSHKDRPVVLVGISGGGSRAAALGWSVLEELRKFRYTSGSKSRTLLDDIAVVSSVSGGSVIAAHFALYGTDGLDRFEPEFLEPDNMRTLGMEAANPFTWFRLAITGSPRTDVVEQLFDERLFKYKTFSELNQPGKPYLILNATDMASGEVFAFSPGRFDDICSDLDKEPISAAVGASSAIPILLSPIALQDFSAKHCSERAIPPWIKNRLKGRFAPYANLEEFKLARYANDLRHGQNSFRQIDYLYLLDGGLADNLAIHGLLEAISSPYAAPIVADSEPGPTKRRTVIDAINRGLIKQVVVIVINARADPANDIYQSPLRPGTLKMIESVTSIPIDSATASVSSQMEVLMAELNAAGGGAVGDPSFTGLDVYPVQIDFDQLRTDEPVQRELQDKVKSVPTLWTISKEDRDAIYQAGTLLLHQHPCFQRLLLDLGITAHFVDPDFAKSGCRHATD